MNKQCSSWLKKELLHILNLHCSNDETKEQLCDKIRNNKVGGSPPVDLSNLPVEMIETKLL